MSEVFDVEVSPSARLRLFFCSPVPITAFARLLSFGGWPDSPMGDPTHRAPTEHEITAACSRACGQTLYLWGWELRSCDTLAFHFRLEPMPPHPAPYPSWAEVVEAGARVEPDPRQADLFGG